jgi:hypothetical protein
VGVCGTGFTGKFFGGVYVCATAILQTNKNSKANSGIFFIAFYLRMNSGITTHLLWYNNGK